MADMKFTPGHHLSDAQCKRVLSTARHFGGGGFPLHPETREQMGWYDWLRMMVADPASPDLYARTHHGLMLMEGALALLRKSTEGPFVQSITATHLEDDEAPETGWVGDGTCLMEELETAITENRTALAKARGES